MSNAPPKPPGRVNWFVVSAVLAVLLVAGAAGAYTMQATDQAAFCGSCHVMAEAAWTHKQSAHAKLACNECHAPADLTAKIPFKAASGSQDIAENLTKRFSDVIHAEKKHKDVIQANCRRCHVPTVEKVAMDSKPFCIDCHRSTPHRSRTPVSSRKVADG